MAKLIKFSLPVNRHHVRNLEELKDNFVIDEIVALYKNDVLLHWLECRGYTDEFEKVRAIPDKASTKELITALLQAFNIEYKEAELDYLVAAVDFQKEQQFQQYQQANSDIEQQIKAEKARYFQIIDEIRNNPDDVALVKARLNEIADNYYDLFTIDWLGMFNELLKVAPAVTVFILTNPKLRACCDIDVLDVENSKNRHKDKFNSHWALYSINQLVQSRNKQLFKYLQSRTGHTDGYWADLVSKSCKCMIVSCSAGCYVRSTEDRGGELKGATIVNKYVILDGLDYKGTDNDFVYYLVI